MTAYELNVENLIYSQKGRLDLSNADIAKKMSVVLNENLSPERVGHYFSGNSGIPLANIQAFLNAIGLKIVHADEICLTPSVYNALKTFSKQGLENM